MLINYESLMELRVAWATLEQSGGPRTTLLVLDRNFAGHLPSLIRRERTERRLIIAAAQGPLPRLAIGDLGQGGDAGWSEIWCADDWRRAIEQARRSLRDGEELALFWPAWLDQEAAHRPLDAGVDTIGRPARCACGGSLHNTRESVA